jgi:hypothetical protein
MFDWDFTPASLEERAAARNDLVLSLDDTETYTNELVLLAIANVWVTRATADSAIPSYATSATSPRKTIRVATFHPDLSASMLTAASPF